MSPQFRSLSRIVLGCIVATFSLTAHADIIELKNGQVFEAVVLSENDDQYTAQCAVGIIAFAKDTVVNLQKLTIDENQELLKKWDKTRTAQPTAQTSATPTPQQSLLPSAKKTPAPSSVMSDEPDTWIEKKRAHFMRKKSAFSRMASPIASF